MSGAENDRGGKTVSCTHRPVRFHPAYAVLAGGLAGLLIAAVPLWRQQMRATAHPTPALPLPPAPAAASFAGQWQSAKSDGNKTGADLRAAVLAESLTAGECRAAAAAALAAGARGPLRDVLRRWATLDAPAAFTWLERYPELRPETTRDADAAWAASDPAAFSSWMVRHIGGLTPDQAPMDWSIPEAVKHLVQYDLKAAIRVAGAMHASGPLNGNRVLDRNLLRAAIRSNADAEAAGTEILAHPEWLAGLPEGKPFLLLATLRECWQEVDAAGWDRWAAAHPAAAERSDPEPLDPGIAFLRNPDRSAAVREILESSPPEKLQETSDRLLRLWTADDMEAAGEWLNTLPDGPAKAAAAQSYALRAATEEPQAAFRWAATLPDPVRRARTQRRIFIAWHQADPAAAAAWLPQSGWSEAQIRTARDMMAVAPGAAHELPEQ